MINKKVTSVFAYLGLVYWFIAYVAGDREAAKFHLNQGLVMEIGFLILSIATAIPPITFVAPVAMIVFFVFKIIAIVKLAQFIKSEPTSTGLTFITIIINLFKIVISASYTFHLNHPLIVVRCIFISLTV